MIRSRTPRSPRWIPPRGGRRAWRRVLWLPTVTRKASCVGIGGYGVVVYKPTVVRSDTRPRPRLLSLPTVIKRGKRRPNLIDRLGVDVGGDRRRLVAGGGDGGSPGIVNRRATTQGRIGRGE